MEAYELVTNLKFSSSHGLLVQCFATLSKLKFEGYRQLYNDFTPHAERLLSIDQTMGLRVTVAFLMHAMETGWTAKHGTPSEKDAAIEKLDALRTSENLSFDTLRAFFAQMSGVHRESALSGKNEQNGDFAGAAVGGGKGGKEFRHGRSHSRNRRTCRGGSAESSSGWTCTSRRRS